MPPCTRFSVPTSWLPSGQPVTWKTRLRAAVSAEPLAPGQALTAAPSRGAMGVGPPASRALGAKFQQQAASSVISTQKDETSQTDGRHAREDTCKQSRAQNSKRRDFCEFCVGEKGLHSDTACSAH